MNEDADAGLVPVVALAEQVGLSGLVGEHLTIVEAANGACTNPVATVMTLVAGMVAGADSIVDIDRLRHAGTDQVMFVDLDSSHRQVHGYAKEGAAIGRHKGEKTQHPLIASVSTPIARPVVARIRLRRGKAADVRGAARFLAETLAVVCRIAPTATIMVHADSTFYTAKVAATAAPPRPHRRRKIHLGGIGRPNTAAPHTSSHAT